MALLAPVFAVIANSMAQICNQFVDLVSNPETAQHLANMVNANNDAPIFEVEILEDE